MDVLLLSEEVIIVLFIAGTERDTATYAVHCNMLVSSLMIMIEGIKKVVFFGPLLTSTSYHIFASSLTKYVEM